MGRLQELKLKGGRTVLNNPLLTHLTLSDVRSAYESVAMLANDIEGGVMKVNG